MKNNLLFAYNTNILHGTFAKRKYEELSYPKNQKMCGPIQVTLWKCDPIIVNPVVNPAFSGTSPLASYKEVLPTPAQETDKISWAM